MFATHVEKVKSNRWEILNYIFFFLDPVDMDIYDLKQQMLTTQRYMFQDILRIQLANEGAIIIEEEELDSSSLNLSETIRSSGSTKDIFSKLKKMQVDGYKDNNHELEEQINYVTLGRLMAEQLFRNKFACFSVPELSLYIFKLFYYNIVKRQYLLRFYTGFFEYLLAKTEDSKDNSVREALMRKFYGFNLRLFLHFDAEVADRLILLFSNSDKDKEREDLIVNFANLNSFLLKSVRQFEVKQHADLKKYLETFVKGDKKAIKKFGATASMLVSIYIFNYLKGLAESTLPPGVKDVVSHHTAPFASHIHGLIEKFFEVKNAKKATVDYFIAGIDDKKAVIPTKEIENFAAKFEEEVKRCGDCAMCQANALFNDFYLFEKDDVVEQQGKGLFLI